MNTGLDEFEYGFFSNHWLLKTALCYVPRIQLNIAVGAVIDRLSDDSEVTGDELLQMLAQIALTGRYITIEGGASEVKEDMPSPEQFSGFLKQWPDADDPMVDFKLNNKNEEENNDG